MENPFVLGVVEEVPCDALVLLRSLSVVRDGGLPCQTNGFLHRFQPQLRRGQRWQGEQHLHPPKKHGGLYFLLGFQHDHRHGACKHDIAVTARARRRRGAAIVLQLYLERRAGLCPAWRLLLDPAGRLIWCLSGRRRSLDGSHVHVRRVVVEELPHAVRSGIFPSRRQVGRDKRRLLSSYDTKNVFVVVARSSNVQNCGWPPGPQ